MMMADLLHVYPCTVPRLAGHVACPAEELPAILRRRPELSGSAPYLADLAEIEWARWQAATAPKKPATAVVRVTLAPELHLLRLSWRQLPEMLAGVAVSPQPGEEYVAVIPTGDTVRVFSVSGGELLAMKIVAEDLDKGEVARQAGVTIGVIDNLLRQAIAKGLLLAPPPGVVRPAGFFPCGVNGSPPQESSTFTLQWHITQRCDLHCRHCYDRSDRHPLSLDQGLRVLDSLYRFCHEHQVQGQVSFTGGNPMLSPLFLTLYREAADRGLMLAVLGNPMPAARIEEMLAIRRPEFYQVSLEGPREQNDAIRGVGHYHRVIDFLRVLRERSIYSMVMLTLTAANLDHVLRLAEELRDKVDLFTFNRLAMFGEGAALKPADPLAYRKFLAEYLQAAGANPVMSLKDNLFNLLLHREGRALGGGCTGFGCGAAFNFLALLTDGEVHACRKMPSPVGNIADSSLSAIYHGAAAAGYRRGSAGCAPCAIRPVCGGCPAVTLGCGGNIERDIDPYCFLSDLPGPR